MEIPGTLEKCTDNTLTLVPTSFLRCPQFPGASTLNLYILSAPVQLECGAYCTCKENVSALRLVRSYRRYHLGSERPHTTRFISFYWRAYVFVILKQSLQSAWMWGQGKGQAHLPVGNKCHFLSRMLITCLLDSATLF